MTAEEFEALKKPAKIESQLIHEAYLNGCPDCGEDIPADVCDGQACANCEHVFTLPRSCDDQTPA